MPRVRSSNNDPVDFCVECFPDEEEARMRFGNLGNGPDGRGNCFAYDDEHPPYEFEEYECWDCERVLGEEDNDSRLSDVKEGH